MTETALSRQALYSARPTLRLAGQADVRLSNLLIAMRMDESEGGMSRLELRLSNWVGTTAGGTEQAFGAQSDLKLGADLAVYAGDVQAPVEVFRGKVSAIELVFNMGGAPASADTGFSVPLPDARSNNWRTVMASKQWSSGICPKIRAKVVATPAAAWHTKSDSPFNFAPRRANQRAMVRHKSASSPAGARDGGDFGNKRATHSSAAKLWSASSMSAQRLSMC